MKRITGNWLRKYDEQEDVVRIFPELEKIILDRGFEFNERQGILEASSIFVYERKMLRKDQSNWSKEERELWATMKEDISHNRGIFLQKMNRFSSDFFYGGRDCSGGTYHTYHVDGLSFFYVNPQNDICRLLFRGRLGNVNGSTIYIGGVRPTTKEFFEGTESCSQLIIDFQGDNDLGKELKKVYKLACD